MKTVLTITGIRPDFIRMSKVFHRLDEDPDIQHIMMHTGQHYDDLLSGSFFKDLNLRNPDVTLSCGTSSKNHFDQLAYLSQSIIEWIRTNDVHPDLIIFLGDSNSVTAALPLKKEGFTIGHVEAGMRSGDRRMLEEINRTVCDVCSDVFFVYHEDYKTNLLRENIDRSIYVVGNTVVEPALLFKEKLGLKGVTKRKEEILMDIHRPENFKYPHRLHRIFRFANLMGHHYSLPVSCIAYGRLIKIIQEEGINVGKVSLIDPLPFPAYLERTYHCRFLFSDSGTAQEEPALLQTPVIVPRDFTERPQSFASFCSVAFRAEEEDVESEQRRLTDWLERWEMGLSPVSTDWLGDGTTSFQIHQGIREFLQIE